jgi:hypothetical protein
MYKITFQLLCYSGLLNSITMHVILSVPRPSEAAKLLGQILSSINSTIFDIYTPPLGVPTMADPPFTRGDILPELPMEVEFDLLRLRAEGAEVVVTFFDGEAPAFLT